MAQASLELTLCPQIYNPLQACATTFACYCLCVVLGTKPLCMLGQHPATKLCLIPNCYFFPSGKVLLVLFLVLLVEPTACACCVSTVSLYHKVIALVLFLIFEKGFH